MSALLRPVAEVIANVDYDVLRTQQSAPKVSIAQVAHPANDAEFAGGNKHGIVEQPKIEIVFNAENGHADARFWVHPIGDFQRQYVAGFAFAFRTGYFKSAVRHICMENTKFPSVAEAVKVTAAQLNLVLDQKFDGLTNRAPEEVRQEKAIRQWAEDTVLGASAGEFDEKPAFLFADFCSGMGGTHHGMEMAGGKCVAISEIDAAALETLKANGCLNGVWVNTDITKAIPETLPNFDVLIGGTPCQPFSIAGLKQAFDDKRADPLTATLNIIDVKRPKVVILENVLGLATGGDGEWLRSIQITLANLGYNVDSECYNAADFGLPQQRKRIYIVAHRPNAGEFAKSFIAPKGKGCTISVKDVLEPNAPDGKHNIADMVSMPTKSKKSPFRRLGQMHGDMGQHARVYDPSGHAATLMASQQNCGLYLINDRPRALTPRERARLQGFPDSYKLHPTKTIANKQIGNSVAVPIVAAIGRAIVDQFLNQQAA